MRALPICVPYDCGWSLSVAKSYVKKLCDKLGVTFYIQKLDYEELRQMQIAFFKTGLPGLDVPQDHPLIVQIDKHSEIMDVKYILNGYDVCIKAIADPASWFEGCGPTADKTYVKDVLEKHGNVKKYICTIGFKHKFGSRMLRKSRPFNL